MAKNTKPLETVSPESEDKAEETAAAAALNKQLDGVQAELAAARAEIEELAAKLVAAESEKEAFARELTALRSNGAEAAATDSREKLLVRTASGREFWRGGLLFDGQWQEVRRADVGETAWARITGEPALQTKEA